MTEGRTAGRASAPLVAALLLLAALAGAVALAAAQRGALAARLAQHLLARRGVEASFAVSRIGWRGALVEDLRAGAPDEPPLTARRIELAWSAAGLRAGRLDRITAEDVRIAASLDAGGIHLRGLPLARGGGDAGGGTASLPLALPFGSAELRELELRLETPEGPVRLAGDGALAVAGEQIAGVLRLDGSTPYGVIATTLTLSGRPEAPVAAFEASARPQVGRLPIRIESEVQAKGALRRDEKGAARWELSLALPWLELAGRARLERIALDAEGGDAGLRAQLRVARVLEQSRPALLAPLALEASLEGSLERLAVDASAYPEGERVRAEIRGWLEPMARRAELEFRVPETDLALAAPEPGLVFPFLAGRIERARGHLGVSGRAGFEEGRVSLRAEVALRDVDLRTPAFTVRRLNGVVTAEGPPLRTPPGQLVSAAAIEGMLPLADGLAAFELTGDGILRLESATFRMAGGSLRASGRLPLDVEERALDVAAEGLDVEAILTSLGFAGLSGTGTLEGRLPLRQRGARVRIDGGRLRATAPGVLRYRADAGSAAAAARQSQLTTVLGALEDLHYDELELEISGDTAEEISVKVHAKGSNPGFQQGRPVVLNLDVQARLADLVKAGEAAYRVPGEVEERVKRALGGERR